MSPTFVLVPGSWHTTKHLVPLLNVLHSNDCKTEATQLASAGYKSPRPTFADDVDVIYNAVFTILAAGEDVCLMLHSYAGMPGAEAINKLIADGALEAQEGRGRLRRVVFVAAYAFPAGMVLDAREFLATDPNLSIDENGMNIMASPRTIFFNDIPDAEVQQWVDALDVAYYLGRGPVITSEDWRKAPITALLTKQDSAVPSERQEMVWQGMEQEWIDAGHSPFVSQPEEVARRLMRSAG